MIFFIVGLYTVAAVFFLQDCCYLVNNDALSYISIALKYQNGNYSDAVNGYWSPLISWLLVPFLWIESNPITACKIQSAFIGLACLLVIIKLNKKVISNRKLCLLASFSALPLILLAAFAEYVSDLLSAVLLLIYLDQILSEDYFESRKKAVCAGAAGAVAYFAKTFSFPFFIAHYTLIYCAQLLLVRERTSHILKHWVVGFSVFLAMSSVWIGIISFKYNTLTYGTTGSYNLRLMGPESKGVIGGNPVVFSGLLPPPNDTALNAWEDPGLLVNLMKPWSPIDSFENMMTMIKNISRNTVQAAKIYNFFSFFSIIVVFVCLALTVKKVKEEGIFGKNRGLLYIVMTALIYTAGYVFFFPATRHFYFIGLLLITLSFMLLEEAAALFKGHCILFYLSAVIISGSFIYKPFMENYQYYFGKSGEIAEIRQFSKMVYSLTDSLKHSVIQGKTASNDDFTSSAMISFLLNNKYFGVTRKSITEQTVKDELMKHNINYYLVWDGQKFSFLESCPEITNNRLPVLKIYDLNKCRNKK